MPLIQAIVADAELERLERYRQTLEFPTTKTAIVRTAPREWLNTREQEHPVPPSSHERDNA